MAKISKHDTKINVQSIKRGSLGALGEALGNRSAPGVVPGGPRIYFFDRCVGHSVDFGRHLAPLGAKWRPKGAKMGCKFYRKSILKSMQKPMPKNVETCAKINPKLDPK